MRLCNLDGDNQLKFILGGTVTMKMTYQPKKRQRIKEHGFRKRMKSKGKKEVISLISAYLPFIGMKGNISDIC